MDGSSPGNPSNNTSVNTKITPAAHTQIVYLNGRLIPRSQASIDIEDRGFIFADGVYEVIRYYNGVAFAMDQHIHRLTRSLKQVRIDAPKVLHDMASISNQLVQANGLSDASIYWQITRGAAPRNHVIPDVITPTSMAIAYPAHNLRLEAGPKSVSATLEPDQRWARCDIKSLMLLANVLAKDQAHQQGGHEAILHRDGVVTEGSSTSVLAVRDGVIHTHPANQWILDSITRKIVIGLARDLGIEVVEQPMSTDQITQADEIMIAGTTTHLAAVTRLSDKPIGQGKLGQITTTLFAALKEFIFRQCLMTPGLQDR